MRARFYAPGTGRFITKDSWQVDHNRPLSLNRWMYVEGNPINYVDPTGHYRWSCNTDPKRIATAESLRSLAPIGGVFFVLGMVIFLLFSILSLPYGVILSAAQAHVAARRSFNAAFEFREWWAVFRQAIGQFIIAYIMIMAASFIFAFVMQIAMITIVLICILPFLMIPYSAYLLLVTNALYAQSYASGQAVLQPV